VTVTKAADLITPEGRRIAYHRQAGAAPGIVFLGGFRSDMTGTKALHLENWARSRGHAYVRFDYSGHGQSGGTFEDGSIGDWTADARAVLQTLTEGPQVLVGSSMGGWIALLLARAMPDRIAGLVGIAAAPDFTETILDALSDAMREDLLRKGQIAQPSEYSEAPYIITRRLIEDGRRQQVLTAPLHLPFPVRLFQGAADTDVPPEVARRLFDHATGADIRLTLVKGADHRFSTPDCLAMVTDAVADILGVIG
jgi:pimeloyl-ACP methyl ester carboxylesterase